MMAPITTSELKYILSQEDFIKFLNENRDRDFTEEAVVYLINQGFLKVPEYA